MVAACLDALDAAGIHAQVTTEHTAVGLYTGGRTAIIWAGNEADVDRARGIIDAVSAADGAAGESPGSGQVASANGPDRACASCGEDVPPEFAVCWNCGGDTGLKPE